MVDTLTPTGTVSMTTAAAGQLKRFLEEQGTPDWALRVFVAPGGCSGCQYGMTIDEQPEDGDEVIETDGVCLLVDNSLAMYLGGAEIDYTLLDGFTVRNPSAVDSCACGHSFDAGGNAQTARGCGCGN